MIARSNKKGDKKKEDIKLNNVYIKFIMRTHASFIYKSKKLYFLALYIYVIYIPNNVFAACIRFAMMLF